jgi:NAD(P) transhydrogenase subunit alpha
MNIAIPKEIDNHEQRVAATPETVKKMVAAGLIVSIEAGAGTTSSYLDKEYEASGALVIPDVRPLLKDADIILKVQKPVHNDQLRLHEVDLFKEGAVLIGLLQYKASPDLISRLAARKLTAFSLDAIPRIARTQKMDALSSQSNIAGYKAVLMAADRIKKMIPLMMTAAGTIPAAKVFVIGAGVAGLQAIATAKRLGAIVEAFDTRPVVKEQVESLGAKFLAIEIVEETEDAGGYAKALSEETHRKEQALIKKRVQESDIVITTALIPGMPAPRLITEEAVSGMKEGSVIVDLAAEAGGNCVLTESGKEVVKYGVTIMGQVNIPSLVANHASQLYARNIVNFLFELYQDGQIRLDLENEILKGTLVTHNGKIFQDKESL